MSEEMKTTRSERELEDAARLIEEAIDLVGSLAFDLRPPSLDMLGLAATLASHARRQAANAGLDVRLSVTELRHLTAEAETACFRIAQEAITNVIRHAQARLLEVTLDEQPGFVLLEVGDDGVGVALEQQERPHTRGLGLVGMRERAEALGGSIEVQRRPGGGTAVRARFPLRGAN